MDLIQAKRDIEAFIKEKGEPTLVVGPRKLKFQLKGWFLDRPKVNLITLPPTVWERDKIYLELAISDKIRSDKIIMVDLSF